MNYRGTFTKILAVLGTVLAWLPIALMVVLGILASIASGTPRVDYLLPGELFPVAIAGGVLLLWAALRARVLRRLIGWGLAAMLVLLVGSQVLAVVTGLASGAIEAAGWPWALTLAAFAGYVLALIVVAYGGVLLLRRLFGGKARGKSPPALQR